MRRSVRTVPRSRRTPPADRPLAHQGTRVAKAGRMTSNRSLSVILACAAATSACTTTRNVEIDTLHPASMPAPVPSDAATPREPRVPPAPPQDRDRRPWEFTIAGSGVNDDDFDVGAASVAAHAGYYFNEVIE